MYSTDPTILAAVVGNLPGKAMSTQGASATPHISLDGDPIVIGKLLWSMLTKDYIRAMVASIEKAHRQV